MPFRFHCEQCDVRIKVPDGSEGKKVKCPGCGHVQRVPVTTDGPTAAAVVAQSRPSEAKASRPGRNESSVPAATKEKSPPSSTKDWEQLPKKKRTSEKRETENIRPAVVPVEEDNQSPVESASPPELKHHEQIDEDSARETRIDNYDEDHGDIPFTTTAQSNEALLAFLADSQSPAANLNETIAKNETARLTTDHKDIAAHIVPADSENTPTTAAAEPAQEVEELKDASDPVAADLLDQALSKDDVPSGAGDDIHALMDVHTTERQASESSTLSTEHEQQALQLTATPSVDSNPVEMTHASSQTPFMKDAVASLEDMALSNPTSDVEAAVTQASALDTNELSDEEFESPAGEVRELFDDFVRREIQQRQEEDVEDAAAAAQDYAATQEKKPISVSASTTAHAAHEGGHRQAGHANAGEPVVVVKVPKRIVRTATVPANAPVAAEPSSRSMTAEAPVAIPSPAQNRPVPQSISLSASKVVHGDDEQVAHDDSQTHHADVTSVDSHRAQAATHEPPVARPRRVMPPPGFATLLALCWLLRVLACVSLVSLVKLALLWIDAGAKVLDVIIIAPLGLGVVIGLWALAEMARVIRIAARHSSK